MTNDIAQLQRPRFGFGREETRSLAEEMRTQAACETGVLRWRSSAQAQQQRRAGAQTLREARAQISTGVETAGLHSGDRW